MRRLSTVKEERGAVTVIFAISLTVLLGMAALVVDVSRVWQERRELQNGADAAALAIAENCARAQTGTAALLTACANATLSSSSLPGSAQSYAVKNAAAGHVPTATVDSGFNGLTSRSVVVRSAKSVDFLFGPILETFDGEFDGKTVTAAAKAIWGPANQLATRPVAARDTQYGGGGTTAQIDLRNTSSSGAFSFLDTLPGCTTATLTIGNPIDHSDPGNSNPGSLGDHSCTPSMFQGLIFIPIYTASGGTGSGATYTVAGFAALDVTAFKFSGGGWTWQRPGTVFVPPLPPGGSERYIRGTWRSYVAVGATVNTTPGAPMFGITAIQLVNFT